MVRAAIVVALFTLAGCDLGDITKSKDVRDIEGAVKAVLKDSSSATFENVSRCPIDRAIAAGSVNSKNSFGAYAGSEPFFVVDGRVYLSSGMEEQTSALSGSSYMLHLAEACHGKQKRMAFDAFMKAAINAAEAKIGRNGISTHP